MKALRHLTLFLLSLVICLSVFGQQQNYRSFSDAGELRKYLRWSPDRQPLIGAHRGGPELWSPGSRILLWLSSSCGLRERISASSSVKSPSR